MTREEFDVLIQKLERVARQNPRLYIVRLAGLVFVAYGYLALVLFGSLTLCGLMVVMVVYAPATIKLALVGIIAFGGIFIAVLRGLWVEIEPPKGHEITRTQAPKLFAMLDELRAALQCRPFHRVLLVNDFNAAVIQVPRLGVFGWHRNYLLVGLPLMQGLAPDELKAVLAHEFAHSSRGHGRFGNWLYRVRRSWDQIFQQMIRQRSRFGFVLFKFIKWFWPIFNGHAFVLARANEYEADACGPRLASPDAMAIALTRLPLDGSLIREKFWPDTLTHSNHLKEPPQDIMLDLGRRLKDGPSEEDASRWLRQAYLKETNNSDTHPCLKDRLRALGRLPAGVEHGEFPPAPPPPAQNAADVLLGAHSELAARQMSEEWRKSVAQKWGANFKQREKIAQELAAMDKPLEAPPTPAQLWEKARKMRDLHGDQAALPLLEQVLALEPKHAGANFIRGRLYLSKEDPRGVERLETAMTSDPALTRDGCNLLFAYFTRTGQRDKLRPLEHRVDKFQEMAAVAQRERAQISACDTFIPHALTESQIEALRKLFSAEPEIGSAAVARKLTQHFPNNPCFVIGLRIKTSWIKLRSAGTNGKLAKHVASQLHLPGYSLVFVDEKNIRAMGKKIFAVPGSVIYQRVG